MNISTSSFVERKAEVLCVCQHHSLSPFILCYLPHERRPDNWCKVLIKWFYHVGECQTHKIILLFLSKLGQSTGLYSLYCQWMVEFCKVRHIFSLGTSAMAKFLVLWVECRPSGVTVSQSEDYNVRPWAFCEDNANLRVEQMTKTVISYKDEMDEARIRWAFLASKLIKSLVNAHDVMFLRQFIRYEFFLFGVNCTNPPTTEHLPI